MSRRSFAGHTYEHKSRSGFYGDVYDASTSLGEHYDLLELAEDFASLKGFTAALATHGISLTRLEDTHVVKTHRVGKGRDGIFCVVTEPVGEHVSVEDLLRVSPKGLPQRMVAVIGAQLLQGLAKAHELNIMHGGIHPRSVVIDAEGVVKLNDLAVGRALSMAISRDPGLRDILDKYAAPELGKGRITTRSADVFAAAAVIFAMLAGAPPPGTLDISPAFERMIQRALDPTLGRRYAHAGKFLEDYLEALEDDRWPRATTAELTAFMKRARAAVADLPDRDVAESHDYDSVNEDFEPATRVSSDPVADDLVQDPISELIHLSELEAEMAEDEAVFGRAGDSADDLVDDLVDDLADDLIGQLSSGMSDQAYIATSAATPLAKKRDSVPDIRSQAIGQPASAEAAFAAIDSLSFDDNEDHGRRRSSLPLPAPSASRTDDPETADAAFAAIAALGLENTDDTDDTDDIAGDSAPSPASRPAAFSTPPDTAADSAARGDPDAAAALAVIDTLALDLEDDSESLVDDLQGVQSFDDAAAGATGMNAAAEPSAAESSGVPKRNSAQELATVRAPAILSPSLDNIPRPPTEEPSAAVPAPRAASVPPRPAPVKTAAAPTASALDDLDEPVVQLGRSSPVMRTLWIVVAIGALVALVWVIRHQMQLQEHAKEQQARQQAENQAALDEYKAAAPKSGQVVIDSQPDGAAVWMLLGRTPMTTEAMATDMPHQLRIEYQDHVVEDVTITGNHWKGGKDGKNGKQATLHLVLEQGSKSTLPAAPPAPSESDQRGLSEGMGTIEVATEPSGAEVWLLVGFTPGTAVSGYADIEYTFKVRKDGYLPGMVTVKGKDWQDANGAAVERSVKLKRRKRR